MGLVFKSRTGCMDDMHFHCYETKLPSLKLKTWPKQVLGYLPLDITQPPLTKFDSKVRKIF